MNGSASIEPISELIAYTPTTASVSIGNINQSTSTRWWQNKTFTTSAAAGYDAFLLEVDHVFKPCRSGYGRETETRSSCGSGFLRTFCTCSIPEVSVILRLRRMRLILY